MEEFGGGEIITRIHCMKSISPQLKKEKEKNDSLSTVLTLEKFSSVGSEINAKTSGDQSKYDLWRKCFAGNSGSLLEDGVVSSEVATCYLPENSVRKARL